MEYNKEVLPNKLRIISTPLSSFKSVTVLFLSKVGSRNEKKQLNGISHFLEHMAFKGTKKYPTTLDISSRLDSIGGEFNAFTSKEYTGFYVKAASSYLPLVIDILSEMVINPLVEAEEVERERNVIMEEIRMYKDNPARYIYDIYDSLVFGDHPLGWDTAGTEESLKNVGREEIIEYLKTYYTTNNMVVGLAGDTGGENGVKLIREGLSGLRESAVPVYLPYNEKQKEPGVKIYFKDTEQGHFSLGVRSYPLGHPRRYALSILNNILGGSMSSRLFISLRERRGLAYYVRSHTSEYLDAGTMSVLAGVDKRNIEEALKVVIEEFEKVLSEGITEEELNKAKQNIKGHLILELEDSKDVASLYLTHELLEGKIYTPDQIIKEVDFVTKEQVEEVAKELLNKVNLNLAIIGPFKDQSTFIPMLSKFGQ